MSVKIPSLRRWLIGAAVTLVCIVAGFYFYARHRIQNALKQVPEKIGVEVQQSARGFTISKSFEGHTLFKINASKVVQFKEGKGELHDVEITVYGRDSGRFDRIAGKDFEYDALSGEVIAKGEVQIDLESNPNAGATPDQSVPNELKNPVHLKTTDLVFNQKTGNAHANGEVDFSIPHARGSAIGLSYVAQNSLLTLNSDVKINLNGLTTMSVTADRLTLSRVPRMIALEHPHVSEGFEHSEADKATVFLSQENKLERVLAVGSVLIQSERPDAGKIAARQLELIAGANNTLRQAVLVGGVIFESPGGMHGRAGNAILHFDPQNTVRDVRASHGVSLSQHLSARARSQNLDLTAPAINFYLTNGRVIRRAETLGPSQAIISSARIPSLNSGEGQDTSIITAAKFEANFDDRGQLVAAHGGPDARIVSKSSGKQDRISTSQTIAAEFQGGNGITRLVQTGNFAYNDGETRAWADTARYTQRDQMLLLEGSPRVADAGMMTTARSIRLNRLTGTAYGEGDVKTTYHSRQARIGSGLLSSPHPIHITAGNMSASRNPATALYINNVRIWQDANSVEAPLIEFHRERGSVSAQGTRDRRVSTTLAQPDQKGRIAPLAITSDRLRYLNDEQVVHFEGNVIAISKEVDLRAARMDCFLQPSTQATENTKLAPSLNLRKIIAAGDVVVTRPGRRITGNQLVYTASEDKFVMTGGPPSIFDAEHGNVTGVSLTLFGHDGRVLVEGNDKSPAITETRVAR